MSKLIGLVRQCGFVAIFLISAIWLWRMFNGLPDAATLSKAPTSIIDKGGAISMTALPYWDHSQEAAARYGQSMKCSNGYLVVPLELVTTGLSVSGARILSVWVHQNGRWWSGVIDEKSTRDENKRKDVLAYGCTSSLFTPRQPAEVTVKLAISGNANYLSAKPAKLEEKF